jgi:streptogramin lyase
MSKETIAGCALHLRVDLLSAWRDHALPEAEERRIATHVASCPACRHRLSEYDAMAHVLKTLRVPEPVAGYGHNPRLSPARPEMRQALRLRLVPPPGLGALAAVLLLTLLAAALFTSFGSRHPGPVIKPTPTPGHGQIAEYHLPTAGGFPRGITRGQDGNLWFTEYAGNKIGRITPSGSLTEFPLPTPDSRPTGITSGPDGNLWFMEFNSGQIGRITPAGAVTEFRIATAPSSPGDITSGPDGALWFTINEQIGRITPTGQITEFPTPTLISGPVSITAGPDGNLWFAEGASLKIGRITPAGQVTEYPLPRDSGVSGASSCTHNQCIVITSGPDGALWFTEADTDKIGRITLAGQITEYALTAGSSPQWITRGPDGNLWFTENGSNQIGRMTPAGSATRYPIPTANSSPFAITSGPDGTLWFTEQGGNQIGRITV